MHARSLENRGFLLLVLLVTVAFLWTLQGFLLPVFWAVVLAVLFTPLFDRLRSRLGGRPATASLLTLLVIFLLIVVPLVLIGAAVTNEAATLYERVSTGEIDVNEPIERAEAMLPRLTRLAERYNVDIDRVRTGIEEAALVASGGLAAGLLAVGQQAVTFTLLLTVAFYTLFFFLKDGDRLVAGLVRALPLGDTRERRLLTRFTAVTRATVKGTFVIAAVQGFIGGVSFALLGLGSPVLWGVTMGLMSLLPAVGSAIVWIPAALFLVVSGDLVRGLVLVGIGAGIIGLVDNALRPILVGRDAGIPDYVILLSTLGGLAAFGVSGLVVGPVVAGLFLTVWEIFAEDFGAHDSETPQAEMARPDPAVDAPPGASEPSGQGVAVVAVLPAEATLDSVASAWDESTASNAEKVLAPPAGDQG